MVSTKVKQAAFIFLSFYLLILTFVIKLPHIVFILSFFWSLVLSSLLISYISLYRTKIGVEFPQGLSQGEEGVIIHRIQRSWLPLPQLTAQVVLPYPLVSIAPALLNLGEGRGEERFFAMKRGVYDIKELRITSLDFLGIFQLTRKQKIEREMVIYPSYVTFSPILAFVGRGEEGLGSSQPARGGVEFASVREWQGGESIRDIHWKLTAKWRRFFLILHTQAGSRSQTIAIDCSPNGVFGDLRDNTFELSLKVAASLSWATISNGGEVTLLYAKGDGSITRSSYSSFSPLLEELARLEANSPISLPSLLEEVPPSEETSLTIITSLPDDSLLPFLEKQSERGNPPFLLLMDGASFGKDGWFADQFLEAVRGFAVASLIRKGENLKESLGKIWGMRYSI